MRDFCGNSCFKIFLDGMLFERRRNAIKKKSLRNILSETMASFREKYPLVTYEIYSGNADIIKGK